MDHRHIRVWEGIFRNYVVDFIREAGLGSDF
jgi:hypothetical protein